MKFEPLDPSRNKSRLSDCWSRSQRHGRYFENIGDISPIFSIYLRYFAENSSSSVHEVYFQYFPTFLLNIDNFLDFILIFRSTDYHFAISYRYGPISDISTDINDFLLLANDYYVIRATVW